jgi:hypothetical protein
MLIHYYSLMLWSFRHIVFVYTLHFINRKKEESSVNKIYLLTHDASGSESNMQLVIGLHWQIPLISTPS